MARSGNGATALVAVGALGVAGWALLRSDVATRQATIAADAADAAGLGNVPLVQTQTAPKNSATADAATTAQSGGRPAGLGTTNPPPTGSTAAVLADVRDFIRRGVSADAAEFFVAGQAPAGDSRRDVTDTLGSAVRVVVREGWDFIRTAGGTKPAGEAAGRALTGWLAERVKW